MRYKITFLDYWHLSSGLSGGARFDSIVTKDESNIPYIPGKTLKGLIREQYENLNYPELEKLFGKEGVDEGELYFNNAVLDKEEKDAIVSKNLQNYLYDSIASTAIDNNGIAVDDSLREIEVVIPLILYTEIIGANSDITDAFLSVKRVGLNRNRGLGRCVVEVVK